jgi:hypothetical protein
LSRSKLRGIKPDFRIKKAPEKAEHLERLIKSHPEAGIPDECLLDNGKIIRCYKQTIKLFLFSGRIRYERSQLTAQYIFNDNVIFVFNLYLAV